MAKMNSSPPRANTTELSPPSAAIPVSNLSPAMWSPAVRPLSSWSTGLCDCCDDVSVCCLTCWCPCITFGRIAEIVDRGSTSCEVSGALYSMLLCVSGCSCLYSCFYRSKLRGQYFLKEEPCSDCCVHCFCEACALCQEYTELQNQGIHLFLGWEGNLEREKRKEGIIALDPPIQEAMKQ